MTKKRRSVTYKDWVTEEGLLLIEGWARDGLINEQIAHNIGINVSTLYEWQNRFPEVKESLKKGKEVIDRQVENALLKRALGYNYTESKTEQSEKDGIKKSITIKEVVPDVTAQIFWLKNRKPNEWRDKQDIEHTGNMGVNIIDNIPKGDDYEPRED